MRIVLTLLLASVAYFATAQTYEIGVHGDSQGGDTTAYYVIQNRDTLGKSALLITNSEDSLWIIVGDSTAQIDANVPLTVTPNIIDSLSLDSLKSRVVDTDSLTLLRSGSSTYTGQRTAFVGASNGTVGYSSDSKCEPCIWLRDTDSVYTRDTDWNVGIGTTSPQYKLHVEGDYLSKQGGFSLVNSDSIHLIPAIPSYFVKGSLHKVDLGQASYMSGVAIFPTGNKPNVYSTVINTTTTTNVGIVMNLDADSLPQYSIGYQWTAGTDYSKWDLNYDGFEIIIGDSALWHISSRTRLDTIINISADRTVYMSGNVGIGVQTPSANLDLVGTLQYIDGNQANNYVLTSDATGNATWQDPYAYGEMGFGDSSSTIALSQNTKTFVTNSNNDLWSEGAVTLSNFTYQNDTIICNKDGVYELNLRLSGDAALNDVIKLGVYVNGSLGCTCMGEVTSPIGGTIELGYIDILPLSSGDVIEVIIENTANNNDFDVISGKMMVHLIGK